jgi:hypothetical protein
VVEEVAVPIWVGRDLRGDRGWRVGTRCGINKAIGFYWLR